MTLRKINTLKLGHILRMTSEEYDLYLLKLYPCNPVVGFNYVDYVGPTAMCVRNSCCA